MSVSQSPQVIHTSEFPKVMNMGESPCLVHCKMIWREKEREKQRERGREREREREIGRARESMCAIEREVIDMCESPRLVDRRKMWCWWVIKAAVWS